MFKNSSFGNTASISVSEKRRKQSMKELTRGKFYGILLLAVIFSFGIGTWTGMQMGGIEKELEKPQLKSSVVQDKFYLADDGGMVTVYRTSNNEIYEYTNIVVKELPEEIQQEIIAHKFIKDEETLYNFLESYTS